MIAVVDLHHPVAMAAVAAHHLQHIGLARRQLRIAVVRPERLLTQQRVGATLEGLQLTRRHRRLARAQVAVARVSDDRVHRLHVALALHRQAAGGVVEDDAGIVTTHEGIGPEGRGIAARGRAAVRPGAADLVGAGPVVRRRGVGGLGAAGHGQQQGHEEVSHGGLLRHDGGVWRWPAGRPASAAGCQARARRPRRPPARPRPAPGCRWTAAPVRPCP